MKKGYWFLLLGFGLLLSYVVSGPFIAMRQIKTGLDSNDSEQLSEHINFPTLRQNLKEQIGAQVTAKMAEKSEENGFAALGMLLFGKLADGMIDNMVTPSGIRKMLSGQTPDLKNVSDDAKEKHRREPFKGARYTFDSMSKFSAWMPAESGKEIRFVFSRNGLEWELTNIIFPFD